MSAGGETDPQQIAPGKPEAREDAAALQVGAAVAQAIDAMRKVADELTRLASQADRSATVAALKDAGKAASDQASAMAQDFAHDARDLGEAKLQDFTAAVRRNPLAWLAAALGLGLIVGLWKNGGGRS